VARGKIRAVAPSLRAPKGARLLDLGDMEAAPGLVDPWTSTFLAPSDLKKSHGPEASTASGLVRLRPSQARELLRAGVTLLAVTPAGKDGLGPQAALAAPDPTGVPQVLRAPSALQVRFSQAGPKQNPLAPLQLYQSLEKSFQKAKDYRKKRDQARKAEKEYRKKWRDYLEALKRLRKSSPGKTPGKAPATRPASSPASKPSSRPASRRAAKASAPAKKGGKPAKAPVRPKRPAPFKTDPTLEVLAAALEGKIPVRFEAHTALEVKKALQLAWKFRLKTVLVEPWEIDPEDLPRAAELKAVVLYGPLDRPRPAFGEPGFRPALLSRWTAAGLPVALGTRGVLAPRFLRDQAALARSLGLSRSRALQAVTQAAARAAGAASLAGSLEAGKRADILFFRGDPTDPSIPPERIMVGGRFLPKEARQ